MQEAEQVLVVDGFLAVGEFGEAGIDFVDLVAVNRVACGLDDKDVRSTHVFKELKVCLAVRETLQARLSNGHTQKLADLFSKRPVCRA